MIAVNTPRVSPSLEPTTLVFLRSLSTIVDDHGPQVTGKFSKMWISNRPEKAEIKVAFRTLKSI